jgi:acetyl-CoA carboxylase biotin carboxyl carrier protein
VTLTAKEVAEITRLLEDSTFDELYLEMDGFKLSLRRSGSVPTEAAPAASATPPPAPEAQRRPVGGATAADTRLAPDPGVQDVPAPLLGTFYRAPKPGAPPFVEVGSAVEEDTVIGIIEVMKLMNAVRASVRGTVTEVPAQDGVLVEYGETLIRVRKAT